MKKMLLKLFSLLFLVHVASALTVGFYSKSCPNAESIIRAAVQSRFKADPSVTAALLRMHFHDCFVRGCDASILLDKKGNETPEKESGPNQTVREFELIDTIKKALEAQCPNTVSCADIISVATRDSVALAGGPNYPLPTGRRDGLISRAADVNLPGPTFTVSEALQAFQAKKMTLEEMVVLLGGHTVGVAHCLFFSDRLSNFQGTGKPDPTMDPALVSKLSTICASAGNPTAFLDQGTSFQFDNSYYNQLLAKRGVMQIDQELAVDSLSAGFVKQLATNGTLFFQKFSDAMVKMSKIGVLEGQAGQIRKNCRVVNAAKAVIELMEPESSSSVVSF